MHTHRPRPWRVSLLLALLAALLLAPAGGPLAAAGPIGRAPFCREDGLCLSAPHEPGALAATAAAAQPSEGCAGALLVRRAEGTSPAALERALRAAGVSRAEGLLTPGWWRVCPAEGAPGLRPEELARVPGVSLVERDGLARAALLPNDPYYPVQWALPRVAAPDAWEITTGSTDVLIAVIDSGVDALHPDAPAHLLLGWDFVAGDNDPEDDYAHGTHVMGIAAARMDNGTGVAGLCPDCATLAIRVLGSAGTGSWSDVANAISYAVDAAELLGKRLIINLSLGGEPNTVTADAIRAAQSHGALVLAAAGNYGPGEAMFPAALPGVLAVSASDSYDRPAAPPSATFYTQEGDLGAPGVYIYSTVPSWYGVPSGFAPGYYYMSGTSMATPLAAAAAGLVWAVQPGYEAWQVAVTLLRTADVPGNWDTAYGQGRLNVAAAVTAAEMAVHQVYLPMAAR